jgi:poly(3-hydroxybutyrate) depolymerase
MKTLRAIFSVLGPLILIAASPSAAGKPSAPLASGDYFIRQSWSQEKDFDRLYLVRVPTHTDGRKLPVVIFLHGNGDSARGAAQTFPRRFPGVASSHILVFPDGYLKSWNLSGERSKAEDRKFIEAIVGQLAPCNNVLGDQFTVIGNSNGAGLANQMAIETQLPNIRSYITAVSPLNTLQHDEMGFKAQGADNSYRKVAIPRAGVRILNISGTEDHLIPYQGGPSPIPSSNGKLGFLPAEVSTFAWAKAMGHKGERLSQPTRVEGSLEIFSYLDGAVVHCKASGRGHDALGALNEALLLRFLSGR